MPRLTRGLPRDRSDRIYLEAVGGQTDLDSLSHVPGIAIFFHVPDRQRASHDRSYAALAVNVREGVSHVREDSLCDLVPSFLLTHGLEPEKCAVVPARRIIDMPEAEHVRLGFAPAQQVHLGC